jgi:phosphoribosylamine--glycine ligase
MKILVVDSEGLALDLALRFQDHGHDVKFYIHMNKESHPITLGDGLIDKVSDYKKYMDWADLIVLTDNITLMREMKSYKDKDYPIFGIGDEKAKSELDRNYGQDLFKEHGIKTMPYSGPFNSYEEGIKFIEQNPKRWVSKPCGNETDKSLSYVSKSPEDMIFMLMKWKEMGKKQSYILQEFKPGIEMAVGGFFGPHGFNQYFLENFEFKKLMNDDLSVNTGEMGTVLAYTKKSKLADMLLKPLIPYFESINYCGYIDVACIIDEKTGVPYPLETTERFGYPLIQIQEALHKGDTAQWMYDLVHGKDTMKVDEGVISVGVVLANGSFPKKPEDESEWGYPLDISKVKDKNTLHFSEIKLGENIKLENGKIKKFKGYVTAGNYLLTVTGTGSSVKEAADNAYETIKQVQVANSPLYRTDIGKRLEKQLPLLHKMGFAKEFDYGNEKVGKSIAEQYAMKLGRTGNR